MILQSSYKKVHTTYLGNHTPSSNSHASANSDARKYSHIPAEPAVLPDNNRLASLRALSAITQGRIKRMSPREQANIGAKQSTSPDCDGTCVDEYTVKVDEDACSKLDVKPVVYMDRRFDPGFLLEESFISCGVIQLWWQRGLVVGDTI